ncbi:MAG: peptide ABC transporter substrate-binding protein [Pseudohongiella sp.]|nr:peptide ABC transporter substrate-binding protein [Pseudohongiella sp.]MDO9520378.1 peptide ABC transporter substrate-binding protein [Pseudohongiella sp.]
MKQPRTPDDRLLSAAGRQLSAYALMAIAFLIVLMFILNWLAGLTSSSSGMSRFGVDVENNSINAFLRNEPPQMDTMRSTDAISGVVLGHVMEGLLRYDENGELVAGIAERWEQNGTEITYWLRDNARWSNGDPVTAHDFEFAWKKVLEPATASQYSFILYPILNAEKANQGELPVDAVGVRALDDKTLQVTLEAPIAYFDRIVAFVTFLPAQKEFFEQTQGRYGADADKMLYNGPFMMTSWVHGASLRLERNPFYWDPSRAKLDAINFAHMTSDSNTLLNLFKDGQIALTDLTTQMLEEAMFQRWPLERFAEGTVFFTDLNHRPERLTSNFNLRKALQLAQDSDELVNRVIKLPGYLPGISMFPEWVQGVNGLLREEFPPAVHRRNVPLAREHLQKALDELGLERLPPLVLLSGDTPVARLQAEYYQELWRRELGIEIRIDEQTFRQRLDKMSAGDFDLVLSGWGPDYNDGLTFADLYASWNLNNRGRYINPELDAYVRIAQTSLDQVERVRAFGMIQQIVYDDVVHISNYERGYVYSTDPRLKGVVRRVFGAETDYSYAWIEAEAN